MASFEWIVFPVNFSTLSGGSRSDSSGALAYWADRAKVFASQYASVGSIVESTADGAAVAFSELSVIALSGWLGYIPERVSVPTVVSGPLEVYMPDVSPEFAEYPITVEGYAYGFTAYRGIDPSINYSILIIASVLTEDSPEVIDPPPDPENPPDATMQIGRNGDGTYSGKPEDLSILPKYTSVKYIRAKFNTTRVAIIEDTLDGGFMIYEEVAGEPSGQAYIYSGERKLVEIIDAANVPQYRARYVP